MTSPDLSEVFLAEAADLLAEIETAALSLTQQPANLETVNHLFRAFHTIKGSGSMFGFAKVAAFTHHIETMLDQVREGLVPVNEQLTTLVLAAGDQIKALLAAEQGGPPVDASLQTLLLESVQQITEKPQREITRRTPFKSTAKTLWQICFRPNPGLLSNGGSPFLLFRDLKKLGECVIVGHTDCLPDLFEIVPDDCYLWWTVELTAQCSEEDIRDVFLFADDGTELQITTALEDDQGSLDEEQVGSTSQAMDPVSNLAKTSAEGTASIQTSAKESTIRVPADRLDRLVNLVGELVMNQSRLARAAARFESTELAGPVEEIHRLISELRDDVLQIRMLAIGSIFGRFRRLVRDLSMQLGKDIDLITEGEETELDKSILDQLGDPLVHLLRNSIDHGIETIEKRRATGKPERGTIKLSATHRGSDVVVAIQDDGAGINRDAVKAKAISRQLISPEAALTDKEILHLILLPGFSTAQSITSVSGRGVGMDVVKRQVDALRGSLNISSEPGKGTTMSLTLPLTLAIIEGLLVEAADSQYIVPMAAVTENVEIRQSERILNNGRNIIAVRGEMIPYIDLRHCFGIIGETPEIAKIVLVKYEEQRVGLVVDRVLGTHQTVIQSLGKFFNKIDVVSGSTVMGDGRVALILDIAGIIQHAERECRTMLAA